MIFIWPTEKDIFLKFDKVNKRISCIPDRIFQWFTGAKWRHWKFMNKCVNSYATIKKYSAFINANSNTNCSNFYLKKKKLSLVNGPDGNFRFSGDCFCSTSALRKALRKTVTLETGKPNSLLEKDSYNPLWIPLRKQTKMSGDDPAILALVFKPHTVRAVWYILINFDLTK